MARLLINLHHRPLQQDAPFGHFKLLRHVRHEAPDNRLDLAAEELRQALDKVGKDPTVHDHLAEVYFKQGKIREAIQQWEASVSEWKTSSPTEQDPVELAKVTRKLEGAKVRVTEKR